jgi:phospholipid/cholesterol/gamma-HCH transport system substrate-binding protein
VKAVRKYFRPFLAIIGLMAVAVAVSGFILTNQRLRFPFISPDPIRMQVEFDNAQAVTPGQGQTVQVVGMDIKPKFKDVIHTDASASLRPRTGLKDMYIQISPGTQGAKLAKAGYTIPVARTLTDVDLDEILSSFDTDTRDYIQLLVNGAGNGLKGRGQDLAEVFRRFRPTFRDIGRVNKAVAQEREALKANINSLARLNEQLAKRPQDLTQLVDASAATFHAFASEDRNVSSTVRLLPGTLRQATDTLQKVRPFAEILQPAARNLGPAFVALDKANSKSARLGREATPIVRNQIRPFVRASRPLVADLRTAAKGLNATTAPLTRTVKVLNTFFNMLGYNDNGREAPGGANREEGFLFWLAWTTHQGINLTNVDDANGPMRPIFLTGTCTTLKNLLAGRPELEFSMALSPLLATVCDDPKTASIDLPLAKRITEAGQKVAAGKP